MILPLRLKLIAHFRTVIAERSDYHAHKLTPEEEDFIAAALADFSYRAINKYIMGSKEHNPSNSPQDSFLHAVHHRQELDNEIIDLLFYQEGAKYKERKD